MLRTDQATRSQPSIAPPRWSGWPQPIWACACLLHVPRAGIDDAMVRLSRALKPGGILYTSFKYGNREIQRNGRLFNNYDEPAFARLIAILHKG